MGGWRETEQIAGARGLLDKQVGLYSVRVQVGEGGRLKILVMF